MSIHIMDSNMTMDLFRTEGLINKIHELYNQKVGPISPPINTEILCRIVAEIKGIIITTEPDNKASVFNEGLRLPIPGGFMIRYGTMNKNLLKFNEVKIRETICHELAHILFDDCDDERFLHDVARQLLLPASIVENKYEDKILMYPNNLIQVIKELSREFKVAIMLMVRRLTEDLSLLKDSTVTFWKYNGEMDSQIPYNHDSKLAPELKGYLPKYWRDKVLKEAWNGVVSNVALKGYSFFESHSAIEIKGKRRTDGKKKIISFKVQSSPLYDASKNQQFRLEGGFEPVPRILSIERFDLKFIENEMMLSHATYVDRTVST